MSTFSGLEMAKQALFAQQSALYTTGHNISNVNTKGYTRQRVNFETTSPYPAASRNRPEIPGQMGSGVETGSVQRVRNKFLDYQYRSENSKSGYWSSKADAMKRMESLMNEPSENGLSKTLDQFWQSLNDLAVNPESTGARSVVAQRGVAAAETFNYLSGSLEGIRTDIKNQIDVTVKDTNSLLSQINTINKQISNSEPHGFLSNDLYDERDRLIDELSKIVNVDVQYSKSSDSSPAIADGLITIRLADVNNNAIGGAVLVDGKNLKANELEVTTKGPEDAISDINIKGASYSVSADAFSSPGALKGRIESYGYHEGTSIKGDYPKMIQQLDKMAKAFAAEFNSVHAAGEGLDGSTGVNFFENTESAATLSVNQAILDNPDKIAASKGGQSGDGSNADLLADIFDKELEKSLGEGTSVKSYYASIIGDMGVTAQGANRMAENTEILRSQVENQRQSVSSVSLDEEMSNMIKFQHAYNAAARSMTAVDEMMDRIINNMGLVGR